MTDPVALSFELPAGEDDLERSPGGELPGGSGARVDVPGGSHPGGTVVVTYPFEFAPSAPAPERAPEGLPPDVVVSLVRGQMPEVKACYEWHLRERPGAGGRLTFSWTIQPSGAVTDVQPDRDELKSPTLTTCISQLLQRLRFPPTPHGGSTEVSFPFVFESAGQL